MTSSTPIGVATFAGTKTCGKAFGVPNLATGQAAKLSLRSIATRARPSRPKPAD
jgi:hypothetical protein